MAGLVASQSSGTQRQRQEGREMNLEELYENFLRLEALLDLDPHPWEE